MKLSHKLRCLYAEPLQPTLNGHHFYSENQFVEGIIFPVLPFLYPPLDLFQGFDLCVYQLISPLQRETVEEEELGEKFDTEITDMFGWTS